MIDWFVLLWYNIRYCLEVYDMNKIHRICAATLACLLLAGCQDQNSEPKPTEEQIDTAVTTTAETAAAAAETPKESYGVLPVLSIQTKSDAEDVMKFVDEPVAKVVAEDMSQWDPSYKDVPEPYYEECTVMVRDADGNSLMDGADAKVKVRGNWTTLYPKKPLRIKFAEKQNLLGLNDGAAFKNWLLLAEYKDASMLRNKAALYAAREILEKDGLYASDAALVQVEVNGEYYGIYLLAEMPQVNEDRVNINEPEKDYTGTDIGYFLEYDGYFVNEEPLYSFPLKLADNAPLTPYDGNGGSGRTIQCISPDDAEYHKPIGMTIHSDIYSQEQHDFIENYVNCVYQIMYEAAYNNKAFVFDADDSAISETTELTPQEAVAAVVDLDSLADMYIISELTCDADITWSSFYLSVDMSAAGNRKLTFQAPWDFDSSMGCRPRCEDGQGFYAANIVPDPDFEEDSANPWLMVLAYADWYQTLVKEKWTQAVDDGVFERTLEMVKNDSEALQADFTRNYQKWNNILLNFMIVEELSAAERKVKTEAEAAEYLHQWLENRIEFLNSQWYTAQ